MIQRRSRKRTPLFPRILHVPRILRQAVFSDPEQQKKKERKEEKLKEEKRKEDKRKKKELQEKKHKINPLFEESRSGGILRIRVLQHMAIIHHQRRLAILAGGIKSSKTATDHRQLHHDSGVFSYDDLL